MKNYHSPPKQNVNMTMRSQMGVGVPWYHADYSLLVLISSQNTHPVHRNYKEEPSPLLCFADSYILSYKIERTRVKHFDHKLENMALVDMGVTSGPLFNLLAGKPYQITHHTGRELIKEHFDTLVFSDHRLIGIKFQKFKLFLSKNLSTTMTSGFTSAHRKTSGNANFQDPSTFSQKFDHRS